MQFQDEVAGGVVLVRPAIQSPDYVPGVSGWQIAIDGSAEFNNVTIRGDGSGDPLVVGPDGLPQVIVRTTPTNGLIVFPTNRPIELEAASAVSAVIDPGAANERAEFQLSGPTVDGAPDGMRLVLASQPADGTDVARASFQTRDGTVLWAVDETEIHITRLKMETEFDNADNATYLVYLTGDTIARFNVRGNGRIQWSSGSALPDVQLYRDAVNVLATDDTFRVYRAVVTDNAHSVRLTGDTASRWFMNADGSMHWGTGTAATDVSLVRSGVGTLNVTGAITARNLQSGTVTITPTVANEWTANVAVVFPVAFTATPALVLTCTAGGPGSATTTELEWCAASVTTTGFSARIRRGNLTATTLTWLAVST